MSCARSAACTPSSCPPARNLIATVHYYGYWPFSVNVAGGYLVTDRSLRIRSGLWKVEEMTMSFANSMF